MTLGLGGARAGLAKRLGLSDQGRGGHSSALGPLVCDLGCISGSGIALRVSPLTFAELCGHRGVPSPLIAYFSAQVTSHRKVGVLTRSRVWWGHLWVSASSDVFLLGH